VKYASARALGAPFRPADAGAVAVLLRRALRTQKAPGEPSAFRGN
jgi:hypothetical protein